jgi:hypothetical protein
MAVEGMTVKYNADQHRPIYTLLVDENLQSILADKGLKEAKNRFYIFEFETSCQHQIALIIVISLGYQIIFL